MAERAAGEDRGAVEEVDLLEGPRAGREGRAARPGEAAHQLALQPDRESRRRGRGRGEQRPPRHERRRRQRHADQGGGRQGGGYALAPAQVQVVGELAALQDQPRPRDGPAPHVGLHHRAQRPALEVRHAEVRVQPGQPAGAQSQAELDVLDHRLRVAGGVEAAHLQEGAPAHRPAPGPEGGALAARHPVGEVVAQVHVLGEEARLGRRVVVRARQGHESGIAREGRAHAFHHVGMRHAVGVEEQHHLGIDRAHARVAGLGGTGPAGQAQHPGSQLPRPRPGGVLGASVHDQDRSGSRGPKGGGQRAGQEGLGLPGGHDHGHPQAGAGATGAARALRGGPERLDGLPVTRLHPDGTPSLECGERTVVDA